MSDKKQIGIFWGNDFLSFAEMQGDKLAFAAAIPRKNPEKNEPAASGENPSAPEDIYLTAAIQRVVRERKIGRPIACVAIPTREIIFRSFLLPVMKAEELDNAVIFEAPRYIPFKLADLFFAYHALPFTEKNVKQNRILFLAIRKSTLNAYCKIFEDAKIEVLSAEPSLFALLKILTIKKIANTSRPFAIAQLCDQYGSMMIVDQQFPQFIRDFTLVSQGSPAPDLKSLTGKFTNELRASLDFYVRQAKATGKEHRIEKIFIFGNQETSGIVSGIKNETGIEAAFLDINDHFSHENLLHPSMANAIGAALTGRIPSEASLNLAWSRKLDLKKETDGGFQSFLSRSPDYRLTAFIAVIAILASLFAWSKNYTAIAPQQKILSELQEFDKSYSAMSTDTITNSISEIRKKIESYKNFLFDSRVNLYIKNISSSLPEGVWLFDLKIKASPLSERDDPQKSDTANQTIIKLEGYAYSPELDRQITLVEDFVKNLKNNQTLAKQLKNAELKSVKKETQQDFSVTRFQIELTINEHIH